MTEDSMEVTIKGIKKIAVIGAGTMGNGIAQVSALVGLNVVMRDVEVRFVEKGLATIDKSLSKFAEKGKITEEEKQEALGRIEGTTDLNKVADADFVIEAIIENTDVKKELFKKLDRLTRDDVILASNTSSIPITEIGAATGRPDKVIGMHFFNPVPLMRLVEVIRGYATSDETTAVVMELARKVGKTPVEANDSPGFISNRILMPMLNEAIFAYSEGVGDVDAIDSVMKLGMNHPMGPLQLADYIGLDVVLYIMNVLYDGFKDPKYRAAPILRKMVAAGHLGKKTGKGFYEY